MKITLNRFDPRKSLFANVFIWFWITTILLVFGSAWLARQIFFELKSSEAMPAQLMQLQSVQNKVQRFANTINNKIHAQDELEEILINFAKDTKILFLAISVSTPDKTLQVLPAKDLLNSIDRSILVNLNSPTYIETASVKLIGPVKISINQNNYLLYHIIPKPWGWLINSEKLSPKIILLLAILLSLGFCYLLTSMFLRPVGPLKKAITAMSLNNTSYRITENKLGIDELAVLGRQFNKMADRIEKQLTDQKALLANISHELKTPLTRQRLSIELIQQTSKDEASENYEYFKRILEENEVLNTMVQSILTLSRYELDEVLHMQVFQLSVFINKIVNTARIEAVNKTVIVQNMTNGDILVQADMQQLNSALSNIISNAIFHCASQVQVLVSCDKENLHIKVKDDGNGVEEKNLQNIFKAFYRESESRESASGRVGLGLAIAKKVVDLHNGELIARNLYHNSKRTGLEVSCLFPTSSFVFLQ